MSYFKYHIECHPFTLYIVIEKLKLRKGWRDFNDGQERKESSKQRLINVNNTTFSRNIAITFFYYVVFISIQRQMFW